MRGLRTDMRITQEQLAALCGLDRTYVGGIERGERNPTYLNLLRLSQALGVRSSELLARAEDFDRPA